RVLKHTRAIRRPPNPGFPPVLAAGWLIVGRDSRATSPRPSATRETISLFPAAHNPGSGTVDEMRTPTEMRTRPPAGLSPCRQVGAPTGRPGGPAGRSGKPTEFSFHQLPQPPNGTKRMEHGDRR